MMSNPTSPPSSVYCGSCKKTCVKTHQYKCSCGHFGSDHLKEAPTEESTTPLTSPKAAVETQPTKGDLVHCGTCLKQCLATSNYKCICGHYSSVHTKEKPNAKPPPPSTSSGFFNLFRGKPTPKSPTSSTTLIPSTSASPILYQGWLKKKSTTNRHLWQPRYYVIRDNTLQYYKTESDALSNTVKGMIQLDTLKFIEVATKGEGSSTGVRLNVHIHNSSRIYEFQAETSSACQLWAKYLREYSNPVNPNKVAEIVAGPTSPNSTSTTKINSPTLKSTSPTPTSTITATSPSSKSPTHQAPLPSPAAKSPPEKTPTPVKPVEKAPTPKAADKTPTSAPTKPTEKAPILPVKSSPVKSESTHNRQASSDKARPSFISSLFSSKPASKPLPIATTGPRLVGGIATLYEGWMDKKATLSRHLWQKRYFVLTPHILCYWSSEKERLQNSNQPSGTIVIDDMKACSISDHGKGSEAGTRLNLELRSTKRIFELNAEDKNACEEWNRQINKLILNHEKLFNARSEEAEKIRLAKLEKVKKEAELEKQKMTARLKSEHEAELQKLKSDLLKKQQEDKQAMSERDAKLRELESKRVLAEAQLASSNQQMKVEYEKNLQDIKLQLVKEKEDALLKLALDKETARQKESEIENRIVARMKLEAENNKENISNKLKQQYQEEVVALKLNLEREAEKSRLETERKRIEEAKATEERLLKQFEDELSSQKAAIALKVESSTHEAEEQAAIAQQQLEIEKIAKLKLEKQLAEFQIKQAQEVELAELERQQKIADAQTQLKEQYKNEMTKIQSDLSAALQAETELRKTKEQEMQSILAAERLKLKIELEKLESEKKLAEQAAIQASEAERIKYQQQLQLMQNDLESKRSEFLVQQQIDHVRETFEKEQQAQQQQQIKAEQEYKQQLKEMAQKLETEQREMQRLRNDLEEKEKLKSAPRVFTIFIENERSPTGMVELLKSGEKSLSDLRVVILDELDHLPNEWNFCIASIPIGMKQESKRTLSSIPANESIFLRPIVEVAVQTSISEIPNAPTFDTEVPMAPPPPSVSFTATTSTPERNGLLDAIKAGKQLKKAAVVEKPAVSNTGNGLSSLLSQALASRRGVLVEKRTRKDSWDANE